MRVRRSDRRRGALAVEGAFVYPVLFLLLFGMIVGGVGVFRYQQVACLAREGSRWAAVHGSEWASDNKKDTAASSADVLQQGVLPLAVGMDPALVSAEVWWVDQTGSARPWDESNRAPTSAAADGSEVTNRVRVTVTYRWMPEMFLAGPLYLRSTSELPMSY